MAGGAHVPELVGIAMFWTCALLFFLFLASGLPATAGSRRVVLGICALLVGSATLSMLGTAVLEWPPPWRERGTTISPATRIEMAAVAALAVLTVAVWRVMVGRRSSAGAGRWAFHLRKAMFLLIAAAIYEGGMIAMGWPPPWRLPLPNQ